jgi:hypothetical protein
MTLLDSVFNILPVLYASGKFKADYADFHVLKLPAKIYEVPSFVEQMDLTLGQEGGQQPRAYLS